MDKIEFQKSGNFSLKDIEMIKTVAASILLPYGFRTGKFNFFITRILFT